MPPTIGSPTRPPPPALTAAGFKELALARLTDAEVLFAGGRYDGAVYLCGYAIEFTLKARVCTVLGWPTYFTDKDYASFKTHDLTVLLNLSGAAHLNAVGSIFSQKWNTVLELWSSQMRYDAYGMMSARNASDIIAAAHSLMVLL